MIIWLWVGFLLFVFGMLALDLGVFNRTPHVIKVKEAFGWSIFWISLSLLFNVVIFFMYKHNWLGIGLYPHDVLTGHEAALQFFTGYIIEKSLSLDNIFVMALIFTYFKVPGKYQHRVLFWGILGALIMRGAMILAGAALIHRFGWMNYVFGGFLIVTAGKMMITQHEELEPEKNILVRLARKIYPMEPGYKNEHFFVHLEDGRHAITTLFVVLLVIESTDVLFAVDSIPAIFAVTQDSFLVFTSNICAILGLRSLYFALAAVIEKFRYLKISLVFVLAYVGVKMILSHHYPIPTFVSLSIIAGIILVGVFASMYATNRENRPRAQSARRFWAKNRSETTE